MNSPFDRFRAGNSTALTAQQQRGLREFDDAGCDRCHRGLMFSDYDLEAEGVRENPRLSEPDEGAGRFRFRTPSLRNVALTAPYMHNGMLATLPDVLRFYDNGRSENPNVINRRRGEDAEGVARLSRNFRRVDNMSDQEMQDIVAFLGALTDENFDKTVPTRVPSGLPPGGLIHSSLLDDGGLVFDADPTARDEALYGALGRRDPLQDAGFFCDVAARVILGEELVRMVEVHHEAQAHVGVGLMKAVQHR